MTAYHPKEGDRTYRLNMSDTISTSVSAAAIFSAEDGCGRPPPNMLNDMIVLGSFTQEMRFRYLVRGRCRFRAAFSMMDGVFWLTLV